MYFRRQKKNSELLKELPLEVYASVVGSLYRVQSALIIGAVSALLASIILYVKSADLYHIGFAIALICVSIVRVAEGRKFNSQKQTIAKDHDQLVIWERRYLVLGSIYVALLGTWCFTASASSSDDFVILMTISITLANLIGVFGRNFGSETVVNAQLVSAGVPLFLGSILFGDSYLMMLGIFLIPFFFGIKSMAERLRNNLLAVTITANENEIIANRFNATLNNISHGIAMIDKQQKFTVVNKNFSDLIGAKNRQLIELTLDEVNKLIRTEKSNNARRNMLNDIGDCLNSGQTRRSSYVLVDKRVIEFNFYPMKEGGVVLLEDISARVASEEEISKLAKYDTLTGLPNRRFFMEEINRLLVKKGELKPCSLFFIDLDKFKEINDSLGHATGDKLLRIISERLNAISPKGSQICRFGGDEFVIVTPKLITNTSSAKFAEEIITKISEPMMLDDHQVIAGATVGISICPQDGNDPDKLLKYSDAALYQAKSQGRGAYAFYSDELGQSIKNRRQLEFDLRQAIELDQLEIYYQPLVNLAQNKINTCEALLRWHHPIRGLVPPDQFISIAEEIGFINQLGAYVLEHATAQCLKWPDHTRVAVNVSSVQFKQTNVAQVVHDALRKTGLPPHRLEIEVTESSMLEDVDGTKETLLQISRMGVNISLDDFGTGFSSLSYLHSLPLDKVKIDRSFISDIDSDNKSMILLEGIANLSRSLGLKIVVEGVETIDQLNLLQERIHVDEIQGYLFGKPVPAENLTNLLTGKGSLFAADREAKEEKFNKMAIAQAY